MLPQRLEHCRVDLVRARGEQLPLERRARPRPAGLAVGLSRRTRRHGSGDRQHGQGFDRPQHGRRRRRRLLRRHRQSGEIPQNLQPAKRARMRERQRLRVESVTLQGDGPLHPPRGEPQQEAGRLVESHRTGMRPVTDGHPGPEQADPEHQHDGRVQRGGRRQRMQVRVGPAEHEEQRQTEQCNHRPGSDTDAARGSVDRQGKRCGRRRHCCSSHCQMVVP